MSLTTPTKLQRLQEALYTKAKQEPAYRFYLLYDKVYRTDILTHAYALSRQHGGAPGVDGVTFEDIEGAGTKRWLAAVQEALREETYRPQPVRRVLIPKPGGGERPLGIPTIRDRVVQTAAMLILQPIFEADMDPTAYGYRPGRGALEAVQEVHRALCAGYTEVVDADLSGYFDSIPHAELMKSVARRIIDPHMLRLVKMWLDAPVEETDERGRTKRTTENCDQHRGTPQGGCVSPLLANLYMRRFLLAWKQRGLEERLQTRVVNYADDFVVLCRGTAHDALRHVKEIMGRLKLTVNETKTRVCAVPADSFDFLGYTFGREYDPRTGYAYIGARPSAKRLARYRETLREITRPNAPIADEEMVQRLNRFLRGWSEYFSYGTLAKTYRVAGMAARDRLRRWLCRKHKREGQGIRQYPASHLYGTLGLLDIERRLRQRRTAHVTT